ncbi:TonB-dependent receptor [Shewanella xiamenensis]|uniref:TonB-dependent receptor plug domain-containing protein n=1 Tax=Shewanella TaxID=22 RepID=UPI0002EC101D|nr:MULTISPECIES: TonB-dependent receptor [Shewanella]MCT8859565.1 TonB-dependent receptor [Shewanella xiamenensis]MDH1627119.1 TonB-dependent receptor [Shewanella xiamenensis]MDN5501005.1 TonB-dependent receptor [Shewanella sp.]MDN5529032.1 TonB-dependent receptor [Shewanella sp.]MDV5248502.1 TonB-dependent receptor [Shewanella xiamenensis]
MHKNNLLAKSVRFALIGGVAATALNVPLVMAADEAGADKKVERIEVTGSRIKRTDMEAASPVLVMNRDELEATGMISIGDILQTIPAAGSALNTAFNNGGDGSTNMDLRNLGAQRLLVLVNGKRWISSLGSTVDLNTIPTSSIERIEVLKDGASAVYGSDAIAGVVNIITRKNFEGVEVSVYGGQNAKYDDGRQYTADFTAGSVSEKGGLLFNMSHVTQQPIWAGDRDISDTGYSSTADNTRLQIVGSQLNQANQDALAALATPNPDTGIYNLMVKEGTGTNVGPDQFRPRTGADVYNYAPDNYLSTPQNRNSFYVQGFYDISDNLRVVSDFMMTNRKSSQELAPMPVTLGASWGEAASRVDIGANNIYNPFGETLYGSSARAVANGKPLGYVPYSLQRRMIEAGSRQYNQNDTTYRAMLGLEGNIDDNWTWSASYIYGQNNQDVLTTGLLNLTRINQALGDNCNASNGCVALNLFGGPGTITQDMVDYITFDSVSRSGLTMKDYTFNISGDLFDLPAGAVGLALGLERREESGFDTPDPLTVTGESSGNQRDATSGGFRLDEAYVELAIPVLESLLITPAVRVSDHDAYGNNTTGKVGAEFRPMDDLLLRGTWAQGYRAPSISDLYAGNADSFPTWTDPCNTRDAKGNVLNISTLPGCAGVPDGYRQSNTQIRISQVSSPDLKPETSESFTYGAVYNPSWLEGAEVTLDYYKIKVEDAIARYGHVDIARECARGTKPESCNYIDRDSLGNIVDLRNFLQNSGEYNVEGIDFFTAYRFPETSFGSFKASLDVAYVMKNEFDGTDRVGVQTGDGGFPEFKSNLMVDWAMGDWDAHWKVRFVGPLNNDYYTDLTDSPEDKEYYQGLKDAGYRETMEAYMVHNVSVGYNIDAYNTKVSLGINNLFAKKPQAEGPTNNEAISTNNFSVTEYDVNMDRFIYLRATTKF